MFVSVELMNEGTYAVKDEPVRVRIEDCSGLRSLIRSCYVLLSDKKLKWTATEASMTIKQKNVCFADKICTAFMTETEPCKGWLRDSKE